MKFAATAQSALVTGASSGIGAALAIELARRGARQLFLCGRNRARLDAVAQKCAALGAAADAQVVDVTDAAAVRDWLARCEERGGAELAISNAGVATGAETAANVRNTFEVNVGGNLNVALGMIEIFRQRGNAGRRQLAITASIAGYAPLASCPSYSATKAAMKTWALAMRRPLAREGIAVNAICPGFVRSGITDLNTCPMPFFMEADAAARIILDRLDANVGLIAFPWPMRFAVWLLSVLPWRVAEWVAGLLPAKTGGRRR